MNDKSINYFDTFGISAIHKVCLAISSDIKSIKFSKNLLAINLTEHYLKMSLKERLCMLIMLHDAFDGQYRDLIQKLNIPQQEKENYIQMARDRNF